MERQVYRGRRRSHKKSGGCFSGTPHDYPDTFDMRNSGAVTWLPHSNRHRVRHPYAVRQHEDTTLNHKTGRACPMNSGDRQRKQETYLKLLSSLIGEKNRER